jgi:hypothetical protein
MMQIGITGTRDGMSRLQKKFCGYVFEALSPEFVHQGDCVGADADAYKIAQKLGFKTVCHPPVDSKLRAWTVNDETRNPKSYFARNRNIVDETDILLGFPSKCSPRMGGTWYTIDYALKKSKPVIWFSQYPEKIVWENVDATIRTAITKIIGNGSWKTINIGDKVVTDLHKSVS